MRPSASRRPASRWNDAGAAAISRTSPQMVLGVLARGNWHQGGACRLPEWPAGSKLDLHGLWLDLAQLDESACFDLFLLAEVDGLRGSEAGLSALSRDPARCVSQFEPMKLPAALTLTTRHIDQAGTTSTTYDDPDNVVRMFASIDHLRGMRIAWNILTFTVQATAANFEEDMHLPHRHFGRDGAVVPRGRRRRFQYHGQRIFVRLYRLCQSGNDRNAAPQRGTQLVSRPDLAREHGPAPARASGAHVFRRREYEANKPRISVA